MDYMDNRAIDNDIEENIDITEEKNTDSTMHFVNAVCYLCTK